MVEKFCNNSLQKRHQYWHCKAYKGPHTLLCNRKIQKIPKNHQKITENV